MKVDLFGINQRMVTFEADETAVENTWVKITADDTVGACADGDIPIGLCTEVQDGCASVLMSGVLFAVCEKTDLAAIQYGYQTMSASGPNTLKANAAGRPIVVLGKQSSGMLEILL